MQLMQKKYIFDRPREVTKHAVSKLFFSRKNIHLTAIFYIDFHFPSVARPVVRQQMGYRIFPVQSDIINHNS